jgi:hypothetical protein
MNTRVEMTSTGMEGTDHEIHAEKENGKFF